MRKILQKMTRRPSSAFEWLKWVSIVSVLCVGVAFTSTTPSSAQSGESTRSPHWWSSIRGNPVHAVEKSEAAIRAQVVHDVMRGIRTKDSPEYAGLKGHKAVALQLELTDEVAIGSSPFDAVYIFVNHWGEASGEASVSEAKSKALRRCGSNCMLYAVDDQMVGLDVISAAVRKRAAKNLKEQVARLSEARVLDLTRNANRALRDGPKFKEEALSYTTISLGYPDHQQDYAAECQNRVFYVFEPVVRAEVPKLRLQLSELAKAGLYGSFQRPIDTINTDRPTPPGTLTDTVMRFARAITPEQIAMAELPANMKDALQGYTIKTVWIEGSARTTHAGIPLLLDEYARPLAIETDKGFFRGIQVRLPDPHIYCLVSMPFGSVAVRFEVDVGDQAAANRVSDALLQSLRGTLMANPIAAAPISNEPFRPGEMGFQRADLPSLILGEPNYERSTYFVSVWTGTSTAPEGNLYSLHRFQGPGDRATTHGASLVTSLRVNHILERAAHRLGDYREPSQQEANRFDGVVRSRVQSAIVNACAALEGRMDGEVCVASFRRKKSR
jgi:hypothetical protein